MTVMTQGCITFRKNIRFFSVASTQNKDPWSTSTYVYIGLGAAVAVSLLIIFAVFLLKR